eukprot:CAMPEP_0206021830 /NCGR_PEP_ID=MMETSP1464-20131121/33632_1 /ASSEMBLY_ACC=CAM_ASM_001124 /TAXON_ID=119497 /ORGANISM="Exanthemachrysis gayraliae, Strain RCC1523" /LENGTH=38 /DNA_ID= /DNA_START= /DNA_END= /DNA_ORIENTATION=
MTVERRRELAARAHGEGRVRALGTALALERGKALARRA